MSFIGQSNQGVHCKTFDYHRKELKNPFYNRRKKTAGVSNLKAKAIIAIVLVILGTLVWLIYFSSVFKIKNIEIVGLNKINSKDVRNLIGEQMEKNNLSLTPQNNLIFFDKKMFSQSFRGKYRFQEIKIRKKLLNSILLDVKEKDLAAIWLEDDKYYYLDNEGYILSEVNSLEIDGQQYPVIKNDSNLKINGNKISLNNSFISYSVELLKKIQKTSPELSLIFFSVDSEIDSISIILSNGPKITFNTQDSPDKQLERLVTLKNEKMKDDFETKKYIDLRFGEKIYYQ